MPNEYTVEKHSLEREKKTLEHALDLLTHSHDSWKDLGSSYKKFADLVSGDAGVDGVVFPHAEEAAKAANAVHHKLEVPPESSKPPARLIAHIKAYLAELKAVEKECEAVEKLYVESHRYEKKSQKLARKADRAAGQKDKPVAKVTEKRNRNLDKYENERNKYNNKLASVMDMLKRSNAKFDKVLHCAHAAYWLQQDEVLTFIVEKTADARGKANEHKDELVNYDLGAMAALKWRAGAFGICL